jgi:hypothetical protein
MVRRTAIPLLVCALGGGATACTSGSFFGSPPPPPLASCNSASTVGTHISLAVGAYLSLDPATDSGCVLFPANSSANQVEYLLVPQSADAAPSDSSAFQLNGGALSAATMPGAQRLAGPSSPRATAVAFDAYRRGLARRQAAAGGVSPLQAAVRLSAAAAAPPQPAGPPVLGSQRTFVVCANLTCSGTGGTKQVTATAQTVGQRIAIYVDNAAPAGGLNSADLDTLKNVFDTRIFPLDTVAFGQPTDVDTNGVVLVLMTGVVNSLVTSTVCANSGFVAGFFLSADLDTSRMASFNKGEIFYSIVADSAGTLSCTHTRTQVKRDLGSTFTHELQHMINFGQHAISRPGTPEEGWLDEGLSKYAEELAGRSYLQQGDTATFSSYAINDVYDAYQYLSATGNSPLLIPIDQGTLPEIGASWLFVRYLVDQYGATLPRMLVQTALAGSPNVAAQTGQPFTTTVTRWALANWMSDQPVPGFVTPAELSYTSWHFRTRTFPSLNAQDPTHFPLPYPLVPGQSAGNAIAISGWIRSGSGVYERALQDPSAPGFALLFSPNGNAGPFPSNLAARLNVIRIR